MPCLGSSGEDTLPPLVVLLLLLSGTAIWRTINHWSPKRGSLTAMMMMKISMQVLVSVQHAYTGHLYRSPSSIGSGRTNQNRSVSLIFVIILLKPRALMSQNAASIRKWWPARGVVVLVQHSANGDNNILKATAACDWIRLSTRLLD